MAGEVSFKRRDTYDFVHLFMHELGLRVAAQSGRASDGYHIGKLILQSLKEAPEYVSQINGGTGESETSKSVLKRSIECAAAMQKYGLKEGDVISLLSDNNLGVCLPYYAGLYIGVTVSLMNPFSTLADLQHSLENTRPKIVFCQTSRLEELEQVKTAINEPDMLLLTFDESHSSLKDFIEKYKGDVAVDTYRGADIDIENTIAVLIETSGTTDFPKCAAWTHKSLIITLPYIWSMFQSFPAPIKLVLTISPLQWISSTFVIVLSPIFQVPRLQTTSPTTNDHIYYLLKKYQPNYCIISPPMLASLISDSNNDKSYLSCLETIILGGSAISIDIYNDMKNASPNTSIYVAYGMTEIGVISLNGDPQHPLHLKPTGLTNLKLVDVDTNKDIKEPNKPGELWASGSNTFEGYYKQDEATKRIFEDGWVKTGDIFLVDDDGNYQFVDRLKRLLKYRNYQVSPVKIELLICKHPAVLEVAVTGIPTNFGDLIVACVVRKPGGQVTAQEIKDLVKNNLSDAEQLRGGVVFMDTLPKTTTYKIDQKALKGIVLTATTE